MKRKILSLLSIFAVLLILNSQKSTLVEATNEDTNNTIQLLEDAKSGILIERNTGRILYEQNAHVKRSPASMTKIMSMLLVTDAIESGKLKWDDIITVSAHASSYGGSQVYLAENEKISVEDLYKGMVIASGNDATVAFAEAVAGSEELFVQMMNERAQELGLKNTVFKDPTGLTSYSDGHYSTAYDMAMLSRTLLHEHQDIVLKYTQIYEDYLREGTDREFWLVNTNRLVRHVEGLDGLKTGWTRESGYNLTATMNKNDMRLISVIMGNSTPTKRSSETMKMLNYGYTIFEVKEFKPNNHRVGVYKSVYLDPGKVDIITKEPIYFVVKKGEKLDGYLESFDYDFKGDHYETGDVIGKYQVLKNGEIVYEVDLTVSQDVSRIGFFGLFSKTIKKTFFG